MPSNTIRTEFRIIVAVIASHPKRIRFRGRGIDQMTSKCLFQLYYSVKQLHEKRRQEKRRKNTTLNKVTEQTSSKKMES